MKSTVITNKHSNARTAESNVYDYTSPSKENEVEEDLDRCALFAFLSRSRIFSVKWFLPRASPLLSTCALLLLL